MEHLHDIMALQINNFNSFFNSCNNLQGLSGRDNIYYIHVLGYVKGALRGACSSECVDSSII